MWMPRRGEQVRVQLGTPGLSPPLMCRGVVVSVSRAEAWRTGTVTVDVRETDMRHVVEATRILPVLRVAA